MLGHAGDHALGWIAEALRPVLPDHIVIASDAAGGDDHGLGAQREFAGDFARAALAALDTIRLEDRAADAINRAVGDREPIDAVAEPEGQAAAGPCLARAPLERLDNPGAGAPGDMGTRHRNPVAHRTRAAADPGKNSMPPRPDPPPLPPCRECHVGFRPALRPKILIAVEPRRPDPVLQREIVAVLDAEPALFGRIDQE